MKLKKRRAVAVLASSLVLCAASACAGGDGDGGSDSGKGPIKVGVIADVTGPISQGQEYAVKGAQARIDALNADGGIDGRKVDLVVGDTASSPQGTLTAAKKLIQQDKVQAILAWTYLYNTSADFVASQKIPVFGGSWDSAPGWRQHETMFGTQPLPPAGTVSTTTYPTIYAKRGVKKLAVVGLDVQSSIDNTDGVVRSIEDAGMKNVYLNQSTKATDADFTSVAIAIKKSGAEGVYASLPASQVYALATALRQQDVKLKMFLGATGYGQALLENPTALAGAEGAAFVSWYAPKELNTPATRTMAENLKKYAKYEGSFDFSAAGSYLNAVGFIAAAKAGGGSIDATSITKGARSLDNFDGEGLLAHPADWSKPDEPITGGLGYGGCTFVTTVKNGAFKLLDTKPVCGTAKVVS
jgi:branched-chain amino acid transport system substrate-binding protein